MQQLSTELAAHLAQEVTTLATCWRVTRKDGTSLYFTDHDADLVVDGDTYRARSGITPSAVSSQLGLAVDNLELEGMLQEDGIRERDVLSGIYDHVEVSVFMVNAQAPNEGMLPLKSGWLGEMRLKGGGFVAEIRGISSLLQQTIGQVYTSTCRAKLGDARCTIDLETVTVSGTVTASDAAHQFRDSGRGEAKNYFAYGLVRFTSGTNAGLSMEVRAFAAGEFTLFLPMPNAIAVGDSYTAVAGCDKAFETCVNRFDNAVNFRGEPHVPGTDKMLETSATRSK